MAAKKSTRTKARGPGRLSATETAVLETRLLDAAEGVFLDQGYAGATMDAVAKAAGITRKTLYARHANKEEMFAAVVDRMLEKPPELPAPMPSIGKLDPRRALMQLARELVEVAEAPRTARLSRLVYAEAAHAPELVRIASDMYSRLVDSVRHTLAALRSEGRLPKMPEINAATALFIEMTISNARSLAILGQPLPRNRLAEHIDTAVVVFLRGCGEVL